MAFKKSLGIIIILVAFCMNHAFAQQRILKGVVLDKQSDEPIPFASVVFKVTKIGKLTDSLGRFEFAFNRWPEGDTLQILNVGYKVTEVPVAMLRDSVSLTVYIEVLPPKSEAIVKSKYNRALWFWRKIIANKPRNDRSYFDNFGYEVYNKLEVDLNKVNKDKLEKNIVLKPLKFAFDYTDTTSEKDPFAMFVARKSITGE